MIKDNGIFINILFVSAFDQMQVDHTWIPLDEPIYDFTRDSLFPREQIMVTVKLGEQPIVFQWHVNFLVMDSKSGSQK